MHHDQQRAAAGHEPVRWVPPPPPPPVVAPHLRPPLLPPPPGPTPSSAVPRLRSWTTIALPLAGLGACLVAVCGLLLPAVSAAAISVRVLAIPGLGEPAFAFFAAATVLPVIDLVRGRLVLTGWLTVIGVIGVLGGVVVLALADLLAGLVRRNVGAVSVGPGLPVVIIAEAALVGVGVTAWLAAARIRTVERQIVPDTRPAWLRR